MRQAVAGAVFVAACKVNGASMEGTVTCGHFASGAWTAAQEE